MFLFMRISEDLNTLGKYLYHKRGLLILLFMLFPASFILNNLLFKQCPYKLDDHVTTLIDGDSQFVHGLDPDVIPNSVNVAQAAEPYSLTYHKIEYICDNNPGVKNIIIPYTPLHFTHTFDNIYVDKVFSNEMLKRSVYLMKSGDIKFLGVDYSVYIENLIRYRLIPDTRLIYKYIFCLSNKENGSEFSFIGTYEKLNNDTGEFDIAKLIEDRFEGYRDARGLKDASYLDSISLYAKKRRLKLFFVGMPLLREFYRNVPDSVNIYMESNLLRLKKITDIKYIKCYTLLDDTCFIDYGHLNGKGAFECSKYLTEKLKMN